MQWRLSRVFWYTGSLWRNLGMFPSSWAVTGDTDWWLFGGLHSCCLSLGILVMHVWTQCVSWLCSEWYTKEAAPGRRCGFTLLLCFCFLGAREVASLWNENNSIQLFCISGSEPGSCVNFLSKASKINWISGEKPNARWKEGECSVGIGKQFPPCKEIASTD